MGILEGRHLCVAGRSDAGAGSWGVGGLRWGVLWGVLWGLLCVGEGVDEGGFGWRGGVSVGR